MPAPADHLRQAAANEEFADFVRNSGKPEHMSWAVTALFYAAVHLGRAYVQRKEPALVATSHQSFASHFLRLTKSTDLYRYYRELKDESERGRYDCVKHSASDYDALARRIYQPFKDLLK